jgi:hypothetical protein
MGRSMDKPRGDSHCGNIHRIGDIDDPNIDVSLTPERLGTSQPEAVGRTLGQFLLSESRRLEFLEVPMRRCQPKRQGSGGYAGTLD